jgi:flagellar basal body P-ring formation protein FlgA
MRIHHLITAGLVLLGNALAATAQPAGRAEDAWLEDLAYQLTQHFLPDGQLTLEWTRARPIEAGEATDLTILSYPSSLAPQLIVRVRATGAKGATEHSLVLRAQLWRDGWSVREPSNRGEPVSVSMLDPLRFDALREREAVVGLEDLDVVFSRNVPNGRLLTWRDVSRRPLVRRGQMIEVAASEGSLTVTLRAVALADAARGEVVRVRNPDSRREFSAQVVADGRAQVRF